MRQRWTRGGAVEFPVLFNPRTSRRSLGCCFDWARIVSKGRTDVDGGLAADDLRGERGQGGRIERIRILDRQSVLSDDVAHVVKSFGRWSPANCVVCAALSERVWRVEVAELRRVTSFRRRFRAATGEWNANG